MTSEFQKFTPDTVDEQIERISNSVPTNTENYNTISGEHVVRHLHHLYQSEQRDRALAQGWQRIVQASNSTKMIETKVVDIHSIYMQVLQPLDLIAFSRSQIHQRGDDVLRHSLNLLQPLY